MLRIKLLHNKTSEMKIGLGVVFLRNEPRWQVSLLQAFPKHSLLLQKRSPSPEAENQNFSFGEAHSPTKGRWCSKSSILARGPVNPGALA